MVFFEPSNKKPFKSVKNIHSKQVLSAVFVPSQDKILADENVPWRNNSTLCILDEEQVRFQIHNYYNDYIDKFFSRN